MTWPGLAALSAAALALTAPAPGLAAVHGRAVSSALAAPGPAYAPGSRLCAAGTRNFRVFWDETRGSRHLPSGQERPRPEVLDRADAASAGSSALVEPMRSRRARARVPAARERRRPAAQRRRRPLRHLPRPPAVRRPRPDRLHVRRRSAAGPAAAGRRRPSVAACRWPSTPTGCCARRSRTSTSTACSAGSRRGSNLLPPSIVEGTANWMAAAVIARLGARRRGRSSAACRAGCCGSAGSTRSITRAELRRVGLLVRGHAGGDAARR